MRANKSQLLSCEKQALPSYRVFKLHHTYIYLPSTKGKASTATKSWRPIKPLRVLLLHNIFNFIFFIYAFFTHTNFVQSFTANETRDSFSQSNAAHWGPWKLTKKNMSTVYAWSWSTVGA